MKPRFAGRRNGLRRIARATILREDASTDNSLTKIRQYG
jgi:hypothetical protein